MSPIFICSTFTPQWQLLQRKVTSLTIFSSLQLQVGLKQVLGNVNSFSGTL